MITSTNFKILFLQIKKNETAEIAEIEFICEFGFERTEITGGSGLIELKLSNKKLHKIEKINFLDHSSQIG